jgi:murein DD-endopeptidase MepM/ murein hydrolase activator NlpD
MTELKTTVLKITVHLADLFTMRYKFYIASGVAVFVIIVFLAIYAGVSWSSSGDESMIDDRLIAEEIQLDTDFDSEDSEIDTASGSIIYDDSFVDIIINYEKKKDDIKDRGHKESPGIKDLAELRKKDRRWHLSAHKIRKNDTLWLIAKRYKSDYKLILKVNNIVNPTMLSIGNTILVPNRNGISYKVKKGDSIASISKKFKVDKKNIISNNTLKSGKAVSGKMLFIPDAREYCPKVARGKKGHSRVARSIKIFIWPLHGSITSSFGKRRDPLTKSRRFHTGLDIGAPIGTSVKAAADGKVVFSGWKDGYGNVIILEHKNGYITVYAHNKRNLVREETEVKTGEEIALSGMTGSVTGAHLHFEVRKNITPLNPYRFLK